MKTKQIESGDVFPTNEGGSVTVVKYRGWDEVVVIHNDNHAHVTTVRADHLRNGRVRNPYHPSVFGVGFVGVGHHLPCVNRKNTQTYDTWNNMLERCYNPKFHARCPTYIGCSVHPDWHNFQNFAEWYERQYWAECWQLDKDLLVDGNKVYSADTCTFVPSQLNTLLCDSGASRGDLPQGVSRDRKGYKAQIRVDGKPHHLGMHATPDDAFQAYKLAKEANVKRMAEQYKCLIDPRVYDSLMRYAIELGVTNNVNI